jgi:hypothetical protein
MNSDDRSPLVMLEDGTNKQTTTIHHPIIQPYDDLFDASSTTAETNPYDTEDDEETIVDVITQLKVYGTLFGWLIGVFIQFSSLGANQFIGMNHSSAAGLMTENHPNYNDDALWAFPWWSLFWSFVTSAMGVAMLWLLRKPILSAMTNDVHFSYPNSKLGTDSPLEMSSSSLFVLDPSHSSILDVCFSMGALAGVCMAWMVTDVAVLGWTSRHLWHSALTLATSMATCHILVRYWFHPQPLLAPAVTTPMSNTIHDLEQPLLPKNEDDGFIVLIPTSTQHHSRGTTAMTTTTLSFSSGSSLRPVALVLGGLVGIFIQFSSLGANFLSEQLQLDSNQVLVFSLIWSFWTSVMGIGILVVIRRILTLFLDVSDSLLVQIECCFAIGATLGLNVAWTVTDLAMGLETHLTQSFVTLLGTLLWCRLVLYCYGRSP